MHTILITGATDGLGLALAQRYRRQGSRVLLLGRRPPDTLDPTFFTEESYCRVDLAQPDAHQIVVDWLKRHDITALDLVIHNAGVGYVGDVASQSDASIMALVNVNLWAPIALSHALFPFVQRNQGRFVYISSVAADLPAPTYAVYTATKAALDGFARNWRAELQTEGSGVTVQIIHPGAVRTAMHAKSGADPAALGWDRFPTPEQTAVAIEEALLRSTTDATIGGVNRLVRWGGRNLPELVDALAGIKGSPAISLLPVDALPHALVTGAADGIGRAVAIRLALEGFLIGAIDRDSARAIQTQAEILNAGGAAHFTIADLSTSEGMRHAAAANGWPPFDVVVHNAGISCVGPFVTSELQKQRAVLDVNFMAPMIITANLLRERMIAGGATLVFISSLSHFVGYPGASVYAATKDGLAAYARNLRIALSTENVRVLVVYPGPTRTAHARLYSPDNRREQRRMAPETLAGQIVAAIQRGQRQLIPGASNRLMAKAGRLAPRLVTPIMKHTLYTPLAKRKEPK
ncbi:MAG: SDR family NAD(P)-dependent oxidoreductase [Caldilinea sp.]